MEREVWFKDMALGVANCIILFPWIESNSSRPEASIRSMENAWWNQENIGEEVIIVRFIGDNGSGRWKMSMRMGKKRRKSGRKRG